MNDKKIYRLTFCTLLEGDYNFGLAALINSLFKLGYKGSFYVGFRGSLPTWVSTYIAEKKQNDDAIYSFYISDGLQICFLHQITEYHLTNFKPDFMLNLFNKFSSISSLIYLDPDIIVNAPINYFEMWLKFGIAVCEDVNSPIPKYHPRRMAWRHFFEPYGINLIANEAYYANGGFVGVRRENIQFLILWKQIQELMATEFGGLDRSSLTGKPLLNKHQSIFYHFSKTDQDALNCTIEATDLPVCFMGQEAMGFKSGTACLPHALGSPKPWNWNFTYQTLLGRPPGMAVKAYWDNTDGPIQLYSNFTLFTKSLQLRITAFIGRFYSRYGG